VIGTPADPDLRVELATVLLASGIPDRIETAVDMLFDNPTQVCDLFVARTHSAGGILKIVAPPVAEQLLNRKRMTQTLEANLPRLRQKNAIKAEELVQMDQETNLYAAAAALESALDALEEASEAQNTSRPAKP